jgi:hypothetical protein
MKRSLLLLLTTLLVVFELFLLEGFLPYRWDHLISEQLDRIFRVQKYEPHPNMDLEIETVLREHPSYRIALYVITAAIATGNAFLIAKVWKARRRLESGATRPPLVP